MPRLYGKTAPKKMTLGKAKTSIPRPKPLKPSYSKLGSATTAAPSFGFADMGSPPLSGKFDERK